MSAMYLTFGMLALFPTLASAADQMPKDTLAPQLGRQITLVGDAQARHEGAALDGADFYIWIDGLRDWPQEFRDKRVSVTGTVIERHDRPVFVQSRKNRGIQGIPVPKGTDLHKAAQRYLLKDATWKLQ